MAPAGTKTKPEADWSWASSGFNTLHKPVIYWSWSCFRTNGVYVNLLTAWYQTANPPGAPHTHSHHSLILSVQSYIPVWRCRNTTSLNSRFSSRSRCPATRWRPPVVQPCLFVCCVPTRITVKDEVETTALRLPVPWRLERSSPAEAHPRVFQSF